MHSVFLSTTRRQNKHYQSGGVVAPYVFLQPTPLAASGGVLTGRYTLQTRTHNGSRGYFTYRALKIHVRIIPGYFSSIDPDAVTWYLREFYATTDASYPAGIPATQIAREVYTSSTTGQPFNAGGTIQYGLPLAGYEEIDGIRYPYLERIVLVPSRFDDYRRISYRIQTVVTAAGTYTTEDKVQLEFTISNGGE